MKLAHLVRIPALALLAACGGDDGSEELPPTPDLQISGRVIDEGGQPMSGLTVAAYLVGFPSTATAVASLSAPTCDEAVVPDGQAADGEELTGSDGTFTVAILNLDETRCLILKLRPAGAPEDQNVTLAPRLVSPAQIPPASVLLGDRTVGMLD